MDFIVSLMVATPSQSLMEIPLVLAPKELQDGTLCSCFAYIEHSQLEASVSQFIKVNLDSKPFITHFKESKAAFNTLLKSFTESHVSLYLSSMGERLHIKPTVLGATKILPKKNFSNYNEWATLDPAEDIITVRVVDGIPLFSIESKESGKGADDPKQFYFKFKKVGPIPEEQDDTERTLVEDGATLTEKRKPYF